MDSEVADDYADALDALWYRQDCDNDDPLYRRFLAFRSRLASAEAELAALRARIAEAPVGEISAGYEGPSVAFPASDEDDRVLSGMIGQRVRLLREDDGRGG